MLQAVHRIRLDYYVIGVCEHIDDMLVPRGCDQDTRESLRKENGDFMINVRMLLNGDASLLVSVMYASTLRTAELDADGVWRVVSDDDATLSVRMVLSPFLPQILDV